VEWIRGKSKTGQLSHISLQMTGQTAQAWFYISERGNNKNIKNAEK
jgi:hypothetical protein